MLTGTASTRCEQLERIYFWYPRHCLNLTEATRNDLFERIDPNDPTRQRWELLQSVAPFRREMLHLEWLKTKK